MENKNERFVYILLLLILCLASFGLGFYMFKMSDAKEARPVPVNDSITLNAKPIMPGDVTVTNSYVGYAEAINQVQIIPYISGYLQEIPVKAGQFVREGELLITIEPNEYKAKLDAAEASVLQAEAAFAYNQNYYDRVQKSGKKAFSEIEIDNARNNFLQSQAVLKNAEANRALAEVNYGYTKIKAPISGLVGNFTLSPGDYVSPGNGTLLNIVQTDPIRIVFSLTDAEYLNMAQSEKNLFNDSIIRLKTANGKIFPYPGEFKYTDNEINKTTNSLAVYTYFKNDKNELLPNSFVTVEVEKIFKDSVILDKNFIKMETTGNFVVIARNNAITKVKVDIIADKNNQYVLKNTFNAGDLLILDDVSNLKNGANIHFDIIN